MDFQGIRARRGAASRHSERGEGKFKAIVITVILVTVGYCAFKILPAYVAEYQLKDKMQEVARYAVVNRETEDTIRDKLFAVLQDLNIPAKREDIKVGASIKNVAISVSYTVPVDLIVYQTELHFSPSSENASIF